MGTLYDTVEKVQSNGEDTFSNTLRAFNELSNELKERIEELKVEINSLENRRKEINKIYEDLDTRTDEVAAITRTICDDIDTIIARDTELLQEKNIRLSLVHSEMSKLNKWRT